MIKVVPLGNKKLQYVNIGTRTYKINYIKYTLPGYLLFRDQRWDSSLVLEIYPDYSVAFLRKVLKLQH